MGFGSRSTLDIDLAFFMLAAGRSKAGKDTTTPSGSRSRAESQSEIFPAAFLF